ncbi:MAG: glycosyl hydrolase, partial [Parachlamydiaceae bacterium]|nr:glycosyl hydrolase [Parachlamydiaceae bacterium]
MSCISKLKKMILMLISLNCLISSVYAEESSCLMWGFSVEGFPLSKNQLIQLEQDTGIKSKLIQFYLQWPLLKDPYTTIHSTLEAIDSLGAIPCIKWEPMTLYKNNSENIILYQSIMNGHYDDYMQKVANELKNWKKTLIIRFAHEMNIKRYHWGTTEDEYGPNSPEIYIKMFRYIVSFFKKNNVDNVLWAFCPNVDSIPNESWNQIKNYYP